MGTTHSLSKPGWPPPGHPSPSHLRLPNGPQTAPAAGGRRSTAHCSRRAARGSIAHPQRCCLKPPRHGFGHPPPRTLQSPLLERPRMRGGGHGVVADDPPGARMPGLCRLPHGRDHLPRARALEQARECRGGVDPGLERSWIGYMRLSVAGVRSNRTAARIVCSKQLGLQGERVEILSRPGKPDARIEHRSGGGQLGRSTQHLVAPAPANQILPPSF